MSLHNAETGYSIHVINAFTYADAASRTGAVGLVSADNGKIALQSDTLAYYILTDFSGPIWVEITGGGGGSPSAPDTSVQFNNAGAFGGSSVFTFDGSYVNLDGTTEGASGVILHHQADIQFNDLTSGASITMLAPGTISTSYDIFWPTLQATTGQVLIGDPSGQLSWANFSVGGINIDSGLIFSDGSGNLTIGGDLSVGSGAFTVGTNGAISADNGAFSTDGAGDLTLNEITGSNYSISGDGVGHFQSPSYTAAAIASVTGDMSAAPGVFIAASGVTATITMPDATASIGEVISFNAAQATAISLASVGGQTFDNLPSPFAVPATPGITFISDGANWWSI